MKHPFKSLIFIFATVSFTTNVQAQWTGPSSGILSTGNSVLISQNGGLTGTPGTTFPPLFQTQLTGGSSTIYPLHVDYSGKVGIGTNNPGANLHIGNAGSFRMSRVNGNAVCTIDAIGKLMITTDGVDNQTRGLFLHNGTFNFLKVTQSELAFSSNTRDLFKINTNVNISTDLIITDANDAINFRVYTDGTVRAREVRVNMATIPPDYVFEKSYNLLSIKDIELYIEKNKHLPNVQSAKEMIDEGTVNISAMQFKLLEKVEELTLYIIQLKNENDELKKRVSAIEDKK